MDKLDKRIKVWNLIFTDTVNRMDFCNRDFDYDKTEVNYSNSTSLFHLIYSFNELYLKFKKEYAQLDKLELGKDIEILEFKKDNYDNEHYRHLVLYCEPTLTKHDDEILYFLEYEGIIETIATNNSHPYRDDYYRIELDLDKSKVKKHLDLFEKYSLLIYTFNYLKCHQIFGDGTHQMFTFMDNSNLISGLDKLKIDFGSFYLNVEYYAEFIINMGENFSIDYNNSKLVFADNEVNASEEDYNKVLKNVYINKKHIYKD